MIKICEHCGKEFVTSNSRAVYCSDECRRINANMEANKDGEEDIEAVKQCWSLDNLRPLYSVENISKGSAYKGVYYKNGEPYKKVKV